MDEVTRRGMLGTMAAGVAALGLGARAVAAESLNAGAVDAEGRYSLPPLPYAYDALEPHIDEQTMRLHHDKHHQGYVDGLNKALGRLKAMRESGNFDDVQAVERDLAFNGSGHFLHTVFWSNLHPANEPSQPSEPLMRELNRNFGSVKAFRDQFSAAAKKVEGSGWGLLVHEPVANRLLVMQAEKHQNLTAWGVTPLLVIDVWEHAYYLKYQNNRGAYVDAFWNVVYWDDVARRLAACQNG